MKNQIKILMLAGILACNICKGKITVGSAALRSLVVSPSYLRDAVNTQKAQEISELENQFNSMPHDRYVKAIKTLEGDNEFMVGEKLYALHDVVQNLNFVLDDVRLVFRENGYLTTRNLTNDEIVLLQYAKKSQ